MKTVYLAGPMTGYPEHNYPAFTEGAALLREAGYEVVSPAEEHPTDVAPYDTWTWAQFLAADLAAMLLRCDGLVYLPGSHASRGALLEISTARALDWPVLSLDQAVAISEVAA